MSKMLVISLILGDHIASADIYKQCISVCEMELNEHLMELQKILKKPTLRYITVSGIEVSQIAEEWSAKQNKADLRS